MRKKDQLQEALLLIEAGFIPKGKEEVFRDWIEHRYEVGLSVSSRVCDASLRKMKGFTIEECRQAVDEAILRGWQTFYPKALPVATGSESKQDILDQLEVCADKRERAILESKLEMLNRG